MTLDQIETFLYVARARSFSRAAVLLDLAQPTLSGRITTLERELGGPLFHRRGHTLDLTESGRALIPYAERIIALRSEARNEAMRAASGGLGRLTLGANPTCSQYLAPRFVETFWRTYATVPVWVRTALTPSLMESLMDGVIQLALCSQAQADPRAQTLWSYSDPLLLVAGRDHPLGRRGECDRADLARYTILSSQNGPTRLGLRRLLPTGSETPVAIEATAGEVMRQLLLRGVGVTVLPAVAIWEELQRGELVSVTLHDAELPSYEIALLHWPGRALPPAAEAFVTQLRETPMRLLLA